MKEVEHKKRKGFLFSRMQSVIAIFLILILVLIVVQKNVVYEHQERILHVLKEDGQVLRDKVRLEKEAECLLLYEDDVRGEQGYTLMTEVFGQMRIPYDECMAEKFQPELLTKYDTLVTAVTHYNLLGEGTLDIMNWVKGGGNLMIVYPPEIESSFVNICDKLGIVLIGDSMAEVEGLHFTEPYMLGGMQKDYRITDSYDSSMAVQLKDDCKVYLESTGENPVPVVWTCSYGDGQVVVNNLGFLEKAFRGFYSAAYSLLGEVCVYPVVNGSVFYIDDFPSPVPAGDSKYIKKDFGMDIKNFYTQVWWNDIYNLGEQYDIRYTGLVIEEYSDQVEGPYERNTDIQRYQYFGNMLLAQGGEIGFHGFNHMPLALENFDYMGLFDSYKQWTGYEEMYGGIAELKGFCQMLFPEEEFQVYVPPSNIISEEGRAMLAKEFPEVISVAAVYLPGELACEQEYDIGEDGIINTPRTISGYILDDYMQVVALSELNFHFVNSHFQHPDDVLDVDRGADLGWTELHRRISEFMNWLYSSAPDIRNLTGTEFAGAVQRYDLLDIEKVYTDNKLTIKLHGFEDEAWLMIRLNEKEAGKAEGGELTHLQGNLYLLKAVSDEVVIHTK